MKISERIESLEQAEALIEEAIYLIENAVSGTSEEAHARSYIIPHLKTWIGQGNPYDTSIPDYIENLLKEE